jgi:hypothetical protein
MIERTLIALFLLPGLAHAVICKTVDADGVVAYNDVPAHECKTPIKLPEYSRYSPRPIQQPNAADNGVATERAAPFEGYESIRIVKPEANEKLSRSDGKVPLAIALQPVLQPGHRISVFLDDVRVPGSFSGLEIELTGVDPGLHNVRAAVFDAEGQRVIDSAAANFILRKAEAGQIDGAPRPPPRPTPK